MGFEYTQIRAPQSEGGGVSGSGDEPDTEEMVRERAAQLNEWGRIAQKFGMKILVHNHDQEFEPLADSSSTTYDVLLAETDPALVTFELDIGWAVFAGQDPIEMFDRNPGRFELWHVKDFSGTVTSGEDGEERPDFTFVGHGDIDYPTIFTYAETAGLKHYYVEQDNAPDTGESLEEAAASYVSLVNLL
jgi:sugar phosphate isomerase/epimerase